MIFDSSNWLLTITYLQRWYTLKEGLHVLPAGSKTCLLHKNVLLLLITPNRSMSMLDMLQASLRLSTQRDVTYMMMEICISIGTPSEVMTVIYHEAYATKVITKPEYIIMTRKILFHLFLFIIWWFFYYLYAYRMQPRHQLRISKGMLQWKMRR